MPLAFTLTEVSDVFAAVAAVDAAAARLNLPPGQRLQAVAATLEGAGRGLRSAATITLLPQPGVWEIVLDSDGASSEVLTTLARSGDASDLGEPPAPQEWIQRLSESWAAAAAALDQSRELALNLRNELDETNRGVMALYAELDDNAVKLKRANELKSRFLSYASHELRTPLNGIVGLVRLLKSSSSQRSEDDIKQLAFIQKAAEEMREMVNDLLDLAKVEAGKVTIQASEFDLAFVFGALRGIFRPLLQTEEVGLIFEDTSAVPPIYSDEGKVSQILRNLLSNALKFTESGSVRVWAQADGDDVRISVSDTGLGIPPEELPRIFEEFSQVSNRLQRKVRGTGLGLPLCSKFAELLGGRLTVHSVVNQGSTFTLILPRKYEALPTPGADSAVRKPRSRATILVVDDVELDRYLLSRLITAAGDFEVLQAIDGQSGLDAARRELPDLIFLDLNLPRLDGFTVASEIRADPKTRDIPVFAVTAEKLSGEDEERLRSLTRGIILKENLTKAPGLTLDLTPPARVSLLD